MSAAALVLAAAAALAGAVPDGSAADLAAARAWLAAIARADAATARAGTGLPFVYRSADRRKRCNGAIRTDAALSRWTACFRKDQQILVEELGLGAVVEAGARDYTPKALRDVAAAIPGQGRWLPAFINGDGITFSFLFRLDGEGAASKVTALVLDYDVESG